MKKIINDSISLTTSDVVFGKFLNDIRKYQVLTKDEEIRLTNIILLSTNKEDIRLAKEELMNKNLKFVVTVAKSYQHRGLPLPDLINEGCIGLIKAINRFDNTKGYKFISYAVWWISQSILEALYENGRLIRMPMNRIKEYDKINKFIDKYEQENNTKPHIDIISEELGIDIEDMQHIITSTTKVSSYDVRVSDDDDSTLLSFIEDKDMVVDEDINKKESVHLLINKINKMLSEDDKKILYDYLGLGVSCKKTFKEIGEELGVAHETVRNKYNKILDRMRRSEYINVLKNEIL